MTRLLFKHFLIRISRHENLFKQVRANPFMDVTDEYNKVIQSELFQSFIKDNDDYYLAHVYTMLGDKKEGFEIGFYSEKKDKIVVFETNPIKKREEEEAFKEGRTIALLDLSTLKVTFEDALDIAEKARKEKYPSEIIYKSILILQNVGVQVWNVTLISMAFNIINIKIDAETGEVKESSIHSIMNLGTKM
jgi:hypothetical protein